MNIFGKPNVGADLPAVYQEFMAAIKVVTDRHPEVRAIDVIAMLSYATGMAIGMTYADERDLAITACTTNVDRGIEDCGQLTGPVPNNPTSTKQVQ